MENGLTNRLFDALIGAPRKAGFVAVGQIDELVQTLGIALPMAAMTAN
jgi:hypothetical protein